ncbi:hypothetical protein D3C78_1785680 [compost metagenome]
MQEGERTNAAAQIAQRFAVLDGIDQLAGLGQRDQLALVFGFERRGVGLGFFEVGLERGTVSARIKVR